LALFWAKAISEQTIDLKLQKIFSEVYLQLSDNERKINKELSSNQGEEIHIGGYYNPDKNLTESAMRPSETLNNIISIFS
jgi:isocitrate dehydrogenase